MIFIRRKKLITSNYKHYSLHIFKPVLNHVKLLKLPTKEEKAIFIIKFIFRNTPYLNFRMYSNLLHRNEQFGFKGSEKRKFD